MQLPGSCQRDNPAAEQSSLFFEQSVARHHHSILSRRPQNVDA